MTDVRQTSLQPPLRAKQAPAMGAAPAAGAAQASGASGTSAATPPRKPGAAGDLLRVSASMRAAPAENWRIPERIEDAGPEIRRQIAQRLQNNPELVALERRFAAGQIDASTYQAQRAGLVTLASESAWTVYAMEAARMEGVSPAFFKAKHHLELAALQQAELQDLPGKLLEDVRWEVFGKYQTKARQDPTLQTLNQERQARVSKLPAEPNPDLDPRVGEINARIHRRENALRLEAQAEFLSGLDNRIELDAVTRQNLRDFVAQSRAGTLGSGVWDGALAKVITAVTRRPGELDASHAFVGVADGLYYESVVAPPPENVNGVKPSTAVEMFASFQGMVRTQQIPGLAEAQEKALYDFAISKQGLPYNTLGLLFGMPGVGKTVNEDASYYCAEFAARAMNAAGLDVWTRSGITQVDANNPGSSTLTQLEKLLPKGFTMPLRFARALPYTAARLVSDRLAQKLSGIGLTPDDVLGLPRVSPQKLVNAKVNGQALETTFDRTRR